MKRQFTLVAAVLLAVGLSSLAHGAPIGEAAPAFSLQDQNGKTVTLSDLKGKVVVLAWWNEGCPFIVRHAKAGTLQQLANQYKDKGVVVLAINSTKTATNDSNRKAVEQFALNFPILNDASGTIGQAYQAKTTPHVFVIDKQGKLVYGGAVDDDPHGQKSDRVNYMTQAVDAVVAGKPAPTAETKPYGCSVKYAK